MKKSFSNARYLIALSLLIAFSSIYFIVFKSKDNQLQLSNEKSKYIIPAIFTDDISVILNSSEIDLLNKKRFWYDEYGKTHYYFFDSNFIFNTMYYYHNEHIINQVTFNKHDLKEKNDSLANLLKKLLINEYGNVKDSIEQFDSLYQIHSITYKWTYNDSIFINLYYEPYLKNKPFYYDNKTDHVSLTFFSK